MVILKDSEATQGKGRACEDLKVSKGQKGQAQTVRVATRV